MDEEDVGANLKAKLQPRRPGETIKVAQTVLKRRDRNLKAQAKRAEEIKRRKENERKYVRGKVRILKAEQLLKNSLNRIKDQKRLKYVKNKSQAKTAKPVSKGRVLAVCRNGRKSPSAEVKKLLHHMRLRTRHTMTFLPNNEDTAKKLQTVRAYVFWGVPSFKSVFTVVHKKAVFFDREAQTKVALSDNMLVEKHLADLGVICTEDLAHVIHTGADSFDEVMKRLVPVEIGNAKKVNGLVWERKFLIGNIRNDIDKTLSKLMGE